MKLLTFSELKREKGIPYCRDHLRRKCEAGEFPKPISLSPKRLAWVEDEIDKWIVERGQERSPQAA